MEELIMAEFIVTGQTVKAKADDFMRYSSDVRTKAEELTALIASLDEIWEGDAHDAFKAAYEKNKIALENYAVILQKYSSALQDISNDYDVSESKNTQLANS